MLEINAYTNSNAKQGLVDVYSAAFLRSGYSTMNSSPNRVTAFGDSVHISPEAMSLFAQSYTTLKDTQRIEADGGVNDIVSKNYSSSNVAPYAHTQPPKEVEPVENQSESKSESQAQTGGKSDAASLEQQIQTLQGQLAGLISQMQVSGEDSALQGQIASLQAQLQTLQAQLM